LVLAAIAMGAMVRPTAASSSREDQMRAQIVQLLNGERTQRGFAPLPVDAQLNGQAQAWAEHLRENGCRSNCHSSWGEGEIIAWGDPGLRTSGLVIAWMKSPNHRNVLLYGDSTSMGVGTACSEHGEVVATVQFHDVYRPVAPTEQDPIATSDQWGAPCVGAEGAMPVENSTPATRATTTTTPPTTAAPRPRPTTSTTAPPRPQPRPAPTTTAVAAAASVVPVTAAPTTTSTSTAPTTTTTSPRVALRADGTEITALTTPTTLDEALLFAESAATPANAEPAWIAIVVVVVLLSGMRIAAQLQEARAGRRSETG
jgi:hypothetical protein